MIALLSRLSNGDRELPLRDAYRSRLREIANSVSIPSTACYESAFKKEVPLQTTAAARAAAAGETLASNKYAAEAQTDDENRPGSESLVLPARESDAGLASVAAKLGQSLAERWSEALVEVENRVARDRTETQSAFRSLDSLTEGLSSLGSRMDSIADTTDLVGRSYHQVAGCVREIEQNISAANARLERFDSELREASAAQEGMRQRAEAQSRAGADLEASLHNQVAQTEARISASLVQIGERLEAVSRILEAQPEVISGLQMARTKVEAAQQALEQRLDRQAEAVQSTQAAIIAQSEHWQHFRDISSRLAELVAARPDIPALPDKL